MIITQENSKRVVESHDFDSVNCTIDAEDMRYVASLLRNNYSKPVLAVIREIVANGLDANSEANASRRVEVTVPSRLRLTLSFVTLVEALESRRCLLVFILSTERVPRGVPTIILAHLVLVNLRHYAMETILLAFPFMGELRLHTIFL